MNQQEEKNQEIDILEILGLLFKKRRLFFLATSVAVILTIVYKFARTVEPEHQHVILLRTQANLPSEINKFSVPTNLYENILLSDTFVAMLQNNLLLSNNTEDFTFREFLYNHQPELEGILTPDEEKYWMLTHTDSIFNIQVKDNYVKLSAKTWDRKYAQQLAEFAYNYLSKKLSGLFSDGLESYIQDLEVLDQARKSIFVGEANENQLENFLNLQQIESSVLKELVDVKDFLELISRTYLIRERLLTAKLYLGKDYLVEVERNTYLVEEDQKSLVLIGVVLLLITNGLVIAFLLLKMFVTKNKHYFTS